MENPNGQPGQPIPGAPPVQPQQMTKEQKKAEAERQKKIQQEKIRALELNHQVVGFQKNLTNSVIDTPMMFKLGANTLKTMLKADHCTVAVFEEYPSTGRICIVREESNLPVVKEKKPTTKEKKGGKDQQIKKPEEEEDLTNKAPVPKPPPTQPPKPGQLPNLTGVFLNNMQIIEQVRTTKKPLLIPDASKFPEPAVQQFSKWYGIKTMLLLPMELNGEVAGIVTIYTVNDPIIFTANEISYSEKAIAIMAKAVETAPPELPEEMKKKVIRHMTRSDNSNLVIDFFSETLDNVFEYIIGELSPEDSKNLKQVLEERKNEETILRKVWYQLGELIKVEGDQAILCKMSLREQLRQREEYSAELNDVLPPGFKELYKFLNKKLKTPKLTSKGISEELIEKIDNEIDHIVRGDMLLKEGSKAIVFHDVEQSDMLVNFCSVQAAHDFRKHIKANINDVPEEIDESLLLSELSHQGMREISKTVARNIAEKYLFETEGFLDQPEEKQTEQTEELSLYIHRRIMAALSPTLRGKLSSWSKLMIKKLEEKAEKAAKQRAVLVGKMITQEEEEEEGEE